MNFLELFKRHKSERLIQKTFFTAPCGDKYPIELYSSEKVYPYSCRVCGRPATKKIVFLSAKHEVEGDFGSVYFCDKDFPDIKEVATTKNYYKVLYGK
jgi:hypothetical protein